MEIEERLDKLEGRMKEIYALLSDERSKSHLPEQDLDNKEASLEIDTFCRSLELESEKVRYLVDFQKSFPRLIEPIKEKKRTALQFKALMILGLIYKRCYGREIDSEKIRELFKFSRISTDRMDKLYASSNFKKYFSKKDKNIKFSWAGEKEAEKMIVELIKNETDTQK